MLRRTIWLLSVVAVAASAQESSIEEELEIRRYTVEMIIFSYAQGVSGGNEIFVPDEPPPIDILPQDDALVSAPTQSALIEDTRPYEFAMLNEADFSLIDVYDHLRRLSAYEPIAHFGWTQPTYPQSDTKERPLSTFIVPPRGLEGDISLYLSRYLHLTVNLQLDADNAGDDMYPTRYRIQEDRIFRNGELRYFDHPKFGVLAKISRAVEDETELLGVNGE